MTIPGTASALRTLAALVLLSLGRLACAGPQGPLVVAGNAKYQPITFQENHQAKGVVVDIVRALGQRLGRPVEFRLIVWTDAQAQLLQGQVEAIAPMAMTAARRKLFDFSDPVLELQISIFVRGDREGILDMEDLHGLRVGVTTGGLANQLVQSDPTIRMVPLGDDLYTGFQALREGGAADVRVLTLFRAL